MIRYCESYWNDVDNVLDCVPALKNLQNCSILITGATGMICSSLVELLFRHNQQHNANIRIILAGRSSNQIHTRFSSFAEGRDYFFFSYDANLTANLNLNTDYIIHGASNAHPTILTEEPVETILSNVMGLNQLLSAAQHENCRRLLYVSSSEVYGSRLVADGILKGQDSYPYSEEDYGFVDILNSRAAYPNAKRMAETLCISYGQEYGMDTVIVRPGHIYGPSITESDSRASAQFTRSAARGENIVMKSTGTQLRSYCYTLDCASAILAVLLNGKTGNAYNISNKNSIITISDIAYALAKAAGTQVVYVEPTGQEKKGYNPMSNSSLNAEKLERLGWKAIFGLEEGANKTIHYYKE